MNWYKKSQKLPTIDEITWAIDKLIAENYDFSTEEIKEGFQNLNNQYALSKAAKKSFQKEKYGRSFGTEIEGVSLSDIFDVFDLFETGASTKQISERLGIPSPLIAKILKTEFPSKKDRDEYLEKKHTQNILDTTEKLHQDMKKDFSIKGIGPKDIADVLGVEPNFVSKILKANGINDLPAFSRERKRIIAQNVAEIVEEIPPNDFKFEQVIREFRRRYNYDISTNAVERAITIDNLDPRKKDDPESIFRGFTRYVDSLMTNGGRALLEREEREPGTVAKYIDRFLEEKGDRYGFVPPYTREVVKNMFLTKQQIQKNIHNKERYKYTPVDFSNQNPDMFIYDSFNDRYNNEDYNEMYSNNLNKE